MPGRRSFMFAPAAPLPPAAPGAAPAGMHFLKSGGQLDVTGDGSVEVIGKKGTQARSLKDGVHALRDGKFIVIQGGRVVAPDMAIGPIDLPAVQKAGKQPEGRAEGILIGLNQPRL